MGRPTNEQRLGVHIDAAKIYNLTEAAKLLRLNIRTVSNEIKRGHLQAGRVGRRYFITGENLLAACQGAAASNE